MTRETALAQFRLLFGHLQQFHGVGGFLLPVHPLFSLPLWAPPKALSKLGNIRNGDISREKLVTAHSKGEEARKLDIWRVPRKLLLKTNFSGSLDMEDGFFWVLR